MAIDFEEEEEPKIKLAICSQHNLKYDPEVTWGCVLCRTNRKKRKSAYWVVLGILAVAIGIYFLLPVIRPQTTEPTLSAMVSVGDFSTDDALPEDPHVTCLLELSKKIEKCIARASSDSPNERMDKEFCLDLLHAEDENCNGALMVQDYLSEPLYNVHRMPDWKKIRETLELKQGGIEKCVGSTDYDFVVRVMVARKTGVPTDVTVSLSGLNTSQRFCLYQFFKSMEFPKGKSKDYAFVTKVQSTLLAQNKPVEDNSRSKEFRKFVEQQRNAELNEERHAEIMKRRQEFDKKFKSGMTNQ